jgi:hypothetical protein
MVVIGAVAVAVFAVWAAIDSAPKVARLAAAYSWCGSLSGACPEKPPCPPQVVQRYLAGYPIGDGCRL